MSQQHSVVELLAARETGGLDLCRRSKRKSSNSIEVLQEPERCVKQFGETQFLKHCQPFYQELNPQPRSTIAADFNKEGKLLASTHGDHTIKVFDWHTGDQVQTLTGHRRTPWVVRWHPQKSNVLVSGSLDNHVRVWDVNNNGSCIREHNFDKPIASMAFSPEGDMLAVAAGHKVFFWNYTQWDPASCNEVTNKEEEDCKGAPKIVYRAHKSIRAVGFHPGGLPLLVTAEVNEHKGDQAYEIITEGSVQKYSTLSSKGTKGTGSQHTQGNPCRIFQKQGSQSRAGCFGNRLLDPLTSFFSQRHHQQQQQQQQVEDCTQSIAEEDTNRSAFQPPSSADLHHLHSAGQTHQAFSQQALQPLTIQPTIPHSQSQAAGLPFTYFSTGARATGLPNHQRFSPTFQNTSSGYHNPPTSQFSDSHHFSFGLHPSSRMPMLNNQASQCPSSYNYRLNEEQHQQQPDPRLFTQEIIHPAVQQAWNNSSSNISSQRGSLQSQSSRGGGSVHLGSGASSTSATSVVSIPVQGSNSTHVGSYSGWEFSRSSGGQNYSNNPAYQYLMFLQQQAAQYQQQMLQHQQHQQMQQQAYQYPPSQALLNTALSHQLALEDLPITTIVNLWKVDFSKAMQKLTNPVLTIPNAVLCSEMGMHFSPCGRYLAMCCAQVFLPLGQTSLEHTHKWQVRVGYELRVYSVQGEDFGQIIKRCPVRVGMCLTSIQWSPTSEHIILAYGRKHLALLRNMVHQGNVWKQEHTIMEMYRVSDMKVVCVLPSMEDEVNVATWHPTAGEGMVYGTKEGRLRILKTNKVPYVANKQEVETEADRDSVMIDADLESSSGDE